MRTNRKSRTELLISHGNKLQRPARMSQVLVDERGKLPGKREKRGERMDKNAHGRKRKCLSLARSKAGGYVGERKTPQRSPGGKGCRHLEKRLNRRKSLETKTEGYSYKSKIPNRKKRRASGGKARLRGRCWRQRPMTRLRKRPRKRRENARKNRTRRCKKRKIQSVYASRTTG